MAYGLWGASAEFGLIWPGSWPYYGILVGTACLLGAILVAFRIQLSQLNRRRWGAIAILSIASFLLSQFLPLLLPWANPMLRSESATATTAVFAAVPYLLAGATLNVPAAIIVGLFGGLGRALGQTHSAADILAVGLTAATAAALMQQNYSGRTFGLLRRPPVAGALAQLVFGMLVGLSLLAVRGPEVGAVAALDLALIIGSASLVPLLVEGAVGGALVVMILWIAPQWRVSRGTVPSPFRRSLQGRMVGTFLSFALVVVVLSTMVSFMLITRATTRGTAEQMVASTDAAALRLGALQRDLAFDLTQLADDNRLAAAGSEQRSNVMGQLQRRAPQFSTMKLVSPQGIVTSGDTTASGLTEAERHVVDQVLATGRSQLAVAERAGDASALTLGVPADSEGATRQVLLAQVAPIAMDDILRLLPTAGGGGRGLVVDEASRVVLASGDMGPDVSVWNLPNRSENAIVSGLGLSGREVYEAVDVHSGIRQLVYYTAVAGSGWRIAAVVPHAVILRQALGVMGPLILLLLVISAVFFLNVALFGRDTARPLAEMSRASKAIAAGGGLERPIRSDRDDEIGQLTLAFSQMQRALKQRLDELSLLLSVSNDVASNVNIAQGMAAVLQGVLRATGAAGARAIVRNPSAMTPLVFAEGTGEDSLAAFDRAVVNRLRDVDELMFSSPQEIDENLGVAPGAVAALYGIPLRSAGEFQGALVVGYRQGHYFDSSERNLLRTLAGQASVLVHNAHLFAAAEGGRRRLAAILASTTNAVIVTDQTDRILLVNPAMERAFSLRAIDLVGRPVIDAMPDRELARRLSMGLSAATGDDDRTDGKLDLIAGNRAFLASIATVYNADGQALGRVAVLQDVSELKELDRMKSEFLAGVSHDLLSPLTYMRNYAGMLPVLDDPALEREYAGKILSGIERMTRLVNDLLELARIEAGINLQFDRVQVDLLLTDVAQEYASLAHAEGVRLTVEADRGVPTVLAEPMLLQRAVTNLVTNAIKYAPGSGPVILSADASDGEVVIAVADCGPGISAVDKAHLFEKFYRGQSVVGGMRGSGLGLAIVKSVADLHGGRTWCESVTGRGSTFFLALPIKPRQARSKAAA